MSRFLQILLILFCLPALSWAQDRTGVERQFQSWLKTDIWPKARSMGVSRATFKSAFADVTLNWDLPDLVPPGSSGTAPQVQFQAEFSAPSRYFSERGLSGAAATGRKLAQRHQSSLARIEAKTGVPGRILLAIWSRESAYGRAKIPHDAFRVLGTKAFMSTRSVAFTKELIAALQIQQSRAPSDGRLRSSWAGALGQPQFMPSSYLKYATDGNGDGRADIWTSDEDTLASIANYLMRNGWEAGRDWGFEIILPASLSCTLEGPDQRRSIREWEQLGVTRVSGRPFPAHERDRPASILLPAGRHGPAFLVTPNFYVLKEYNMSDLYALYVGHLGDRIQYNVSPFTGVWEPVGDMLRSDVAKLQSLLVRDGYDVGGVDGLAGFRTRRSIGLWQKSQGVTPTCFPTAIMARRLRPR